MVRFRWNVIIVVERVVKRQSVDILALIKIVCFRWLSYHVYYHIGSGHYIHMVSTGQRLGQTARLSSQYRRTTNQCLRFFYTVFFNLKEHDQDQGIYYNHVNSNHIPCRNISSTSVIKQHNTMFDDINTIWKITFPI